MSYYTSSESSDSDAPYCPCCDSSFVHSKALEQHCSAKDHVSCPRCNAILLTWGDLQVHLETSHFYCSNCDRFFDTENSVDQHMWTHRKRSMECWACYAKFKSPAGIFLHLEAGTCPRNIDSQDIIENIVKCRGPWRSYDVDGRPIRCCSCSQDLGEVSAFLQHIENSTCEEGYFGGRRSVWGLLRQLRRNLNLTPVELYGRTV